MIRGGFVLQKDKWTSLFDMESDIVLESNAIRVLVQRGVVSRRLDAHNMSEFSLNLSSLKVHVPLVAKSPRLAISCACLPKKLPWVPKLAALEHCLRNGWTPKAVPQNGYKLGSRKFFLESAAGSGSGYYFIALGCAVFVFSKPGKLKEILHGMTVSYYKAPRTVLPI